MQTLLGQAEWIRKTASLKKNSIGMATDFHGYELRPYACDICGACYKHSSTLYSHKKIHTEETACVVCHKKFSSKNNLRKHLRFVHGKDPMI
ncbi:unnamed protein product [Bemisia tabaci]|uniref:C2H2-type domain-containing protein n=1 Tax=Bemisia tabaci TaxID=7038 RepID=A0A9P0AEB4_BEMTA|nr:unnamed protein product [Bemisia tabaci]